MTDTGYVLLPQTLPPSVSIIDSVYSSPDHKKLLTLIEHFEQEECFVRNNDLFNFLVSCSHLHLDFRLVNPENNFEFLLSDRMDCIISDLYEIGLVNIDEANEYVEISDSGRSFMEERHEAFIPISLMREYSVNAMNSVEATFDTGMIVFDETAPKGSCPWVVNKSIIS